MEFLTGRLLANSLLNMGFYEECREALSDLELDIERIRELEMDAALGNGGLGRLAACFLDSMATLSCPATATASATSTACSPSASRTATRSSIPTTGCATAIPGSSRGPRCSFPVKFGGRVVQFKDEQGQSHFHWVDTEDVMAMAYDTPVPGYDTEHGEQHAALVRQGVARFQPEVLQRGQLHQGGGGQERIGEPFQGALPRRHHRDGARAAAQAAILLRLRLAPGHPRGASPSIIRTWTSCRTRSRSS